MLFVLIQCLSHFSIDCKYQLTSALWRISILYPRVITDMYLIPRVVELKRGMGMAFPHQEIERKTAPNSLINWAFSYKNVHCLSHQQWYENINLWHQINDVTDHNYTTMLWFYTWDNLSFIHSYAAPAHLGQLSRHLLQPPVSSSTDVGETQTRYRSAATLNGLNQY